MRLLQSDIKKYPKLAYYVKINLPQIMNIPSIVTQMDKIANLDKVKLRSALTWNRGPSIKITNLNNAFGEFTPGIHSNEIRIKTSLVTDFENGRDRRIARAGNVYLVGVTLLHELVHWGDDQNGIDRPNEEGEEFERAIYGNVIY